MRFITASSGTVDWYPTLAAAVAEHRPAQIEWCIPGVPSGPCSTDTQAARIQAFPTAVSVERGIVRRRTEPSAPKGTIACYFIGGPGEVALDPAAELALVPEEAVA